jgi:hypothetical protein
MKFLNIFILTFLITIISSCKTIEKKSQEAINKENKQLSKFIQQSESLLKIEMGLPDEVVYSNKGSIFFIYIKKKYGITCERKFEIDNNKIVIGFSSKGCF